MKKYFLIGFAFLSLFLIAREAKAVVVLAGGNGEHPEVRFGQINWWVAGLYPSTPTAGITYKWTNSDLKEPVWGLKYTQTYQFPQNGQAELEKNSTVLATPLDPTVLYGNPSEYKAMADVHRECMVVAEGGLNDGTTNGKASFKNYIEGIVTKANSFKKDTQIGFVGVDENNDLEEGVKKLSELMLFINDNPDMKILVVGHSFGALVTFNVMKDLRINHEDHIEYLLYDPPFNLLSVKELLLGSSKIPTSDQVCTSKNWYDWFNLNKTGAGVLSCLLKELPSGVNWPFTTVDQVGIANRGGIATDPRLHNWTNGYAPPVFTGSVKQVCHSKFKTDNLVPTSGPHNLNDIGIWIAGNCPIGGTVPVEAVTQPIPAKAAGLNKISTKIGGYTGFSWWGDGEVSPGTCYDDGFGVPAPIGSSVNFNFTPNLGSTLSSLSIDGKNYSNPTPSGLTYTFSNIQSGHLVDVSFSEIPVSVGYYKILASTDNPGGSIIPSGLVVVPNGTSKTFTFVPKPGYFLSKLYVNGSLVPNTATYTFSGIQSNKTIFAQFSQRITATYQITTTHNIGGTITPMSQVLSNTTNLATVAKGSYPSFSIAPASGYSLSRLYIDGNYYSNPPTYGMPYTFQNVQANHSIQASFVASYITPATTTPATTTPTVSNYRVTATVSGAGTISPSGAVIIPKGTSKTFTFTPATGYTISYLYVDGRVVPNASTYTFSNVQNNHTIKVSYKALPSMNPPTPPSVPDITPPDISDPVSYKISTTVNSSGSVSPSGLVSVTKGASKTFTFSPSSGYRVAYVAVDNQSLGTPSSYTFSNIQADHALRVTFGVIPVATTTKAATTTSANSTSTSALSTTYSQVANVLSAVSRWLEFWK